MDATDPQPYAVFDSEELLDQRARRPKLKIVDGINEDLDWPQVILSVGVDRLGSGIALLAGPEPDMRWQSFAEAVAELASALEVRLMVGLGGFPAGAPHTRPVKLAATASDAQLAAQVGFISGSIEVPAGIEAAIERACSRRGIPSVGLWARVPHYVAAMPFPAASVALLDGLASITGLVIDTDSLLEAADCRPREGRRAHRAERASTSRWSSSSSSRSTLWRARRCRTRRGSSPRGKRSPPSSSATCGVNRAGPGRPRRPQGPAVAGRACRGQARGGDRGRETPAIALSF